MNSQITRADQNFGSLIGATSDCNRSCCPNAADVDSKSRFPTETVDALKTAGVLSAAVPKEFGGAGCALRELPNCARLCRRLMVPVMVLAMHYIQLGCIARHGLESTFFVATCKHLAAPVSAGIHYI